MKPAEPIEPLDAALVSARVRGALDEDAAGRDATASYVGLGEETARGRIRVERDTTVCGVDVAREVFRQVDGRIVFEAVVRDGQRIPAGTCVCELEGPARAILSGERTAVNFLQRLCGVATLTARYVDAVRATGVTILDTRKTTPLWRELEKYAVRCGGARNHRRDLGAMILVKDNHVRAVGGRAALLDRIASQPRAPFVELEVDSMAFLVELLESPALEKIDRIMLDNFAPDEMRKATALIKSSPDGARIEIEASGGITLDTIEVFAKCGLDFISVGALTHSAVAAPMSLELL